MDTRGRNAGLASVGASAEDDAHEVLTWETFGDAARDLTRRVVDDGFRPDLVLAIARGGLAIAGAVAYALPVKNCFVVNVEYYVAIDERLDLPVILAPALDPGDLAGLRVLLVDDVADTGHTLRLVLEQVTAQVAEVRTAVLYEKGHTVVHAEYVWRRTDQWIDFPWSVKPAILAPEHEPS